MKPRPSSPMPSRGISALALPVVRPPDPTPAWILAQAGTLCADANAAVTLGGVEEGYAEGLRRGEAAVAVQRQRLASVLEAVEGVRQRMFRDSDTHVVDVALAVARELTLHAATLDRDLAVELAKAALEELGRSARVALRVAPADREAVEGWMGARTDGHGPTVVIVEDGNLAAGEYVAEGDLGQVDGRLQARLARIARALREGESA